MSAIRVAFGTDHYQNIYQDTASLVNEMLSRGFEVFWFDFTKVYGKGADVYLPLRKFERKVRRLTKRKMLSDGPIKRMDAGFLDVIIIKKDPPQSHKILKLLGQVKSKTLLINDPSGIMKYESKTYLKKFKNLTVPTYFSRNVKELERFVKKFGDCVLKKDVGFGGKGVYHVFNKGGDYYAEANHTKKPRKINLKWLLRKLTDNEKRELVVVKYLKRVDRGDKRILLFDNRVLGTLLRIPGQKGGWVCNISSGGTIKKSKVTKEEKVIVKSVEKKLKKEGIYMIGVDTLEDDNGKRILSEINTTNPAGVSFIDNLYGSNMSKFVVDWIEKKARKKT